MAIRRNRQNVSYGLTDALLAGAPRPIVSQRAPSTSDQAEIGTIWVDQPNNDSYILTSVVNNSASWINAGGGGGIFSSLTVNGTTNLNGATTIASGAGAINIGTDAVAKAITIGNGTVATGLAITVGANSSVTTVGAGVDYSITSGGGSVLIEAGEAVATAIAISTTSAGGGILMETGAAGDEGLIQLRPAVGSAAAATQVLDAYVGVATYTGLTTAMGASATLTLTNSLITATTGVLVSVSNLNASTNGAFLTIDGITQAVGSIVVSYTNNGAGALGAGDNVLLSFMVLNP